MKQLFGITGFLYSKINIILYTCFRSGFPKVGQVAPLGAMTDTHGATSSKGVRGGP